MGFFVGEPDANNTDAKYQQHEELQADSYCKKLECVEDINTDSCYRKPRAINTKKCKNLFGAIYTGASRI